MNVDTLKKLGFSQKEIDIYLALLQHGKMTPAEVAKITRINRPTVYSVIKDLVKLGIVSEDLGGASRVVSARPVADLTILINREEKLLETKKILVKNAIAELTKVPTVVKYAIPRIVFIPDEDVERHLYKQAPVWSESIMKSDGVWWGFQDHAFVEEFAEWIEWYWNVSSPPKLELNLLSNASTIEETMKSRRLDRRHVRFWEPDGIFTATTWICGDYVVMIDTRQKLKHLIEIHDASLANNLRLVFKSLWKLTEQTVDKIIKT